MIVSRSIDIHTPVGKAYVLMCDPARRARLNPAITPISVELEGGGPVAVGTVCHFRLQTPAGLADYRSRVVTLIPGRQIVWCTDTAVPVEITLAVEELAGHCRFTHAESFEPNEAMLAMAAPKGSRGRFLQWVAGLLPFLDLDAAERLQDQREQALEAKLGEGLERWLVAIRTELEQTNA
jgi:hypothetical protein